MASERTVPLQIKLTTDEREALGVAAEAAGETLSVYVRRARQVERCNCNSHDHVNRGKWIITRTHEPTGLPLSDELCPHYYTREQAREAMLTTTETKS